MLSWMSSLVGKNSLAGSAVKLNEWVVQISFSLFYSHYFVFAVLS